jgi:hypothetical protein
MYLEASSLMCQLLRLWGGSTACNGLHSTLDVWQGASVGLEEGKIECMRHEY